MLSFCCLLFLILTGYDCCFCSPVFTHMAGSSSVWKALSPTVLQAAFNVDPEVEKLFRSKRTADAIFFPPPN
jgi:hypothetical protein